MKKTAFLFPGQGSQSVGMGLDFYQEYDGVRELFDMAEEVTQSFVSRLCFNGPMEDLTRTVSLQPAVTTVNLSILYALHKEGATAQITAGHSLGEYSALSCARVVSAQDTLGLVYKRGELMQRESEKFKGAMSAVINLSIDEILELVTELNKKLTFPRCVTIANHNAERQIVISGDSDSIKEASNIIRTAKGRSIPLKVSGAWHSPLVKGAEEEFREVLNATDFSPPSLPVIFNVTAEPCDDPTQIKECMAQQLASPVKWYDSVKRMIDFGVETFVEVGPSSVLTGLLDKILPKDGSHKIYNVNSMKSLELFLKDGM